MSDLQFEALYQLMLMERMCRIGLPPREDLYKAPEIHAKKAK